ncbi:YciI family protein [Wolinella succinogenes]|uniref:YciI family protein n=1 Tax=Wolinella succinogenes TaxID=844 RepID=UPI00240988D1|nr:YciI family protein [Wolinella succinogenes]
MKNLFVITVTYTKPLDIIDAILPEHRAFLQKGYEAGILLASGPMNPRVGGIILGIFKDTKEAMEFTAKDPYAKNNAASYQVVEFTPVKHAEFLKEFLGD